MTAGLQKRWVVGVATNINLGLANFERTGLTGTVQLLYDLISQLRSMHVGIGFQQLPNRTLSFFYVSFKMIPCLKSSRY